MNIGKESHKYDMDFKDWLLNEDAQDEPYSFKAVFMAGGPGSGKSFIAKEMFAPLNFLFSDSDKIQTTLSKKPQTSRDMRHAQNLAARRASYWYDQGKPVVIDTTGRDLELIVNINKHLIGTGYDTGMVFVHSSLETALQRNKSRNRQADDDYLRLAWSQAQRNIDAYKQIFGNKFVIVDNEQLQSAYLRRYVTAVVGRPHTLQNPIGIQKIQRLLSAQGPVPRTTQSWARNIS